MTDYKDTLNLPHTEFSMKANLAQREPQMLQFWQEINLYATLRTQRKGAAKFILHDGPPYANGHIHCGHALNKILKDIVVKSKSMSGLDSPYVPGWDCHGLPIELNVEKAVGKAGVKISAAEFREKCRAYAKSQIAIQKEEFKRLGVLGDWDNPYTTMDHTYEANIIRALAKIVEQGYLYQGSKPVYWCLDCRSALAEAEVEYENKTSSVIDVRFTVVNKTEFLQRLAVAQSFEGEISVPIWTTTPWTLPANQAVAMNPDINYVIVEYAPGSAQQMQWLVIAEDLLSEVMQRYGIENYRVVANVLGKTLVGIALQHPFYDRVVPIVLGHHVTVEAGTGNVHTAPAHGQDDYVVAQQFNLPIDNPVGDDGCFLATVDLFAGQHVYKVNDKIIDLLKEHNKLLHATTLQHSYPHCWRHKTPVIFRATPQWFISMEKYDLKEKTLAAMKNVTWYPEWGYSRMAGMLENRPDWCISRQRSWGTPITLFVHKKTKQLHPDTLVLMEKVAQLVEQGGIEAWFSLDEKTLLAEDAEQYEKVIDTLDVWFDAGVSHFAVLSKYPALAFPADIYLEGSDQYRGWFNSSLMTSMTINQTAPYRTIITHGFTVDAEGKKMSKSRGNYIAPEDLVKTSGAEILRLWAAATDYRGELTISDEILKRTADAYRRIRNTTRFLLANLFDFDPSQHLVPVESLLALDQWAVARAKSLQEEILKAYQEYQFHYIFQKIQHFCIVDMGSFYLDIIKDRQYTTQKESNVRRSCQTAMYYILEAMTRWLAPILSFTAEEIWQHIPGKREASIFLSTWYKDFPVLATLSMDEAFWQRIMIVRNVVNKEIEVKRGEGVVGSGLAAEVDIYCDPTWYAQLEKLAKELRFVLITSRADIHPLTAAPTDAVKTEEKGIVVRVSPSVQVKCVRCWHRCADVGSDAAHPELCGRCITNVVGDGEVRQFV